jgi:RNA polymerase sigma-70 factor (ECF subfamily)
MGESLEQLFARYREAGDPDLLAQVFDRTAPRLLRVAIHLSRDPATAEDLVQATFVTAIERASSYVSEKPLENWLTGILAHKAREALRAAGRTLDPERLAHREPSTPEEEAGRREVSAALLEAIDELPEPYRQALLLRLQHGLGPAEIAHVLAESPGAIRVRIHRGIEQLRKLLPVGIGASALIIARPARGMAAVREAVIAHAAALPLAAGVGAVGGGVLVVKKIAWIAAAALIVICVWIGGRLLSRQEPLEIAGTPFEALEAGAGETRPGGSSTTAPLAAFPQTTRAPAGGTELPLETLKGRVVDAQTGTGIAGAEVRLFPPRQTYLSDLKRRWADLFVADQNGSPWFREPWPMLPKSLSDASLADLEEVPVIDAPLPGATCSAEAVTSPDGSFEIRVPDALGFLSCRASGYGERGFPTRHFEKKTGEDSGPLLVGLCRPWKLSGYLLDAGGKRLRRSLRLAFWGWQDVAKDPGCGPWNFTTDSEGSFVVEVAASHVQARSLEPGWSVINLGVNPENGQSWVFKVSFASGSDEPAILVAQASPYLLVRDAVTHDPIENFDLNVTGSSDDQIYRAGRFFALGGRLALVEAGDVRSVYGSQVTIRAWSPGYRARDLDVPSLGAAGEIVLDLERGELAHLEGTVMRSGAPVAGATVALVEYRKIQWSEDENGLLDAARTDDRGHFVISVPEGDYLFRCTSAGLVDCETVHVPTSGPFVLDLSLDTALDVRILDTAGIPRASHIVALQGDDGSSRRARTDQQGLAVFHRLAPGGYRAMVAFVSTQGSFRADEVRSVTLFRGEHGSVEIVFPALDPRHALLLVDNKAPGPGWRARDPNPQRGWTEVLPDGEVRINVQVGGRELEIEGPEGGRWSFPIPKDPPDGFPLKVALGGIAYEGLLTWSRDDRPLANVYVCASPVVEGEESVRTSSVSARTDAQGRFRISGLQSVEYLFSFKRSDDVPGDNRLEDIYFIPSQKPSEHPRPLTICIPRRVGDRFEGLPQCEISGVVRIEGETRSNAKVWISSWTPVEDGTLRLYARSGLRTVDELGAYRVVVPCAPRYSAALLNHADTKTYSPIGMDADANATTLIRDLDFR